MLPNVDCSAVYSRQDMEAACLLTDEWIKMWYIYSMECYSAIRKNDIMPFIATGMDLKIVILNEISQRKTNTVCIPYMWNLKKKKDTRKLIYKIETDSQS